MTKKPYAGPRPIHSKSDVIIASICWLMLANCAQDVSTSSVEGRSAALRGPDDDPDGMLDPEPNPSTDGDRPKRDLDPTEPGPDADAQPHYTPAQSSDPRVAALNAAVEAAEKVSAAAVPGAPTCSDRALPTEWANQHKFACFQRSCTEYANSSQFFAGAAHSDSLFPGSLVHGHSLNVGALDPIPVPRGPGKVVLVAVDKTPLGTAEVNPPSLSNTLSAINTILAARPSQSAGDVQAVYSEVRSQSELGLKIGASVSGASWSAGFGLNIDEGSTRSHVLIQVKQRYFTMAFEPPTSPSDFFPPGFSIEQLAPYIADGPAAYVSDVVYGRTLYALCDSDYSYSDLTATVNIAASAGGIRGQVDGQLGQAKSQSAVTCTVATLGGNSSAFQKAPTVTLSDLFPRVTQWLQDGVQFGPSSPGEPLVYAARNISDLTQVALVDSAMYSYKSCNEVPLETRTAKSPVEHAAGNWLKGFSVDHIEFGACDPGFHRATCEAIVVKNNGGWCGTTDANRHGSDGWIDSDPHDCSCRLHLGGSGGGTRGNSMDCQLLMTQEEDPR